MIQILLAKPTINQTKIVSTTSIPDSPSISTSVISFNEIHIFITPSYNGGSTITSYNL